MNIKKIFFVGIKGVGMTSLAILAHQAGFEVDGADVHTEFITDSALKKEGVHFSAAFNTQELKMFVGDSDPSTILVITTGAHGGFENVQVEFAKQMGCRVLSYGEALGKFINGEFLPKKQKGISIAGAHGKTTTAAFLATVMSQLHLDPSYVVGTGELFPLGLPGHYGKGEYFIAEADEYATELKHDKTPKFLYQKPFAAIFNNIDFDHPDFFRGIDDVATAFRQFAENISTDGFLVLNGDDERLNTIQEEYRGKTQIVSFGVSEKNEFFIKNYRQHGFLGTFSVEKKDVNLEEFTISLPGFHNAKNALGVISLLASLGIPVPKIQHVLPIFKGSKRRLEVVGTTAKGTLLVDDYAHHPQEVKTSLVAVKDAYPDKKITCIFQPHTFSRTKALISSFASSFFDADTLIIMPVFASMREQMGTLSEDDISHAFQKVGRNVLFLKNPSSVIEYLNKNQFSDRDIIVTMGAGDVYKIAYSLIAPSV